MTRSHKANDPIRNAEVPAPNGDELPRNFGKHASHSDKAKKNGGGKANWGREGDELMDQEEFNMAKARRRSNSKGHIEDQFVRSKFEAREDEPVFPEEAHPTVEADTSELETTTTNSSTSTDKI